MEKKWWHDKVAYQIYPKSFLDTNGDGIGDLKGIISKLDYLKKLGIDIIWLSPIYKSPFVDQGYDIADYYAIAEEFGTMEEFDELLAEAKKRDMHIIMDLVINHCSDKHEWFQKALADPEGEYADYFYFREGKNGNPPSNYRSYFGGNHYEHRTDQTDDGCLLSGQAGAGSAACPAGRGSALLHPISGCDPDAGTAGHTGQGL